ncbi:MAG TPA: aspartyl-phosphate phosphatase Spo0E family protein [Candidatus Avamphibacillus intestinigallinarum]|nr:aspartyl-phosphate phosphatase Spo0E family protein [Candidatus Avamphibacillus intestinigallinarum]
MIRHGTKYGLADPKTVASSQDLDELLNHYEKTFQHHSNPLNN